jgi:hypothetical protein
MACWNFAATGGSRGQPTGGARPGPSKATALPQPLPLPTIVQRSGFKPVTAWLDGTLVSWGGDCAQLSTWSQGEHFLFIFATVCGSQGGLSPVITAPLPNNGNYYVCRFLCRNFDIASTVRCGTLMAACNCQYSVGPPAPVRLTTVPYLRPTRPQSQAA